MSRRAVVLTALWGALVAATTAVAAPVIQVRARTRVAVDDVARVGAGVRVSGTLVEDDTGEPIADRPVVVIGGDQAVRTVTTADGRFEVLLDLPPGEHDLVVRVPADERYGEAAFHASGFGVGKGTIALEVVAPEELDATADELVLRVEADASGQPEAVPVAVHLADEAGALGALLAEGLTGADGQAHLIVPRAQLGRPGPKRLVVRFAGSPAFNAAQAEATLQVTTTTRFADLTVPDEPVAHEDTVELAGRLVDADDAPVGGGVVALLDERREVAAAATDTSGRFRVRVSAASLGAGARALALEHRSKVRWRRGVRVGPVPVEVLPPRPIPAAVPIGAASIALLAVVIYLLARTRPWRAMFRRLRRRRPGATTDPQGTPALDAAAEPTPGLKPARPGIISSLRRAADVGFTGKVRDAVRGTPVAGARIVLGPPAGSVADPVVARCDDDGTFAVEGLAPGAWRVEVSAPGYVREALTASVPHRGELRGARVDLLPVREQVFALYRDVAAPLLPSSALWGVWTPREILDHVRAARPTGALAALTDLVEETCFSARVPDEDVLPRTATGVDAARRELEGQARAAAQPASRPDRAPTG